jgi:hypothetical protein
VGRVARLRLKIYGNHLIHPFVLALGIHLKLFYE